MSSPAPSDQMIRDILGRVQTIAVVGASPNAERPSNRVMRFLLQQGYRAVGVNPGQGGKTLHGAPVYARLADIPDAIDMVDVFRRPEDALGVVEEALALPRKPSVVWMQLGVVNEEAAAKARAAGLDVVMDRCPAIEIPRLGISAKR